jgi:hypothetical protein
MSSPKKSNKEMLREAHLCQAQKHIPRRVTPSKLGDAAAGVTPSFECSYSHTPSHYLRTAGRNGAHALRRAAGSSSTSTIEVRELSESYNNNDTSQQQELHNHGTK